MTTPFNQIPAGQFVTNTDFNETITSEVALLLPITTFNTEKTQVNCGGQLTYKQNTDQTTFTSGQTKSLFQDGNFTQAITYGDNPPTKKTRASSNRSGTGFKINKAGYYQVYGGYRVAGDNVAEEQRLIIEVDNANDQTVALNVDGQMQRTTNSRWAVNTNGASKITRINPYLHAGVFLNQNDSVYLCIRGQGTDVDTHNQTYYFSVQFVSNNIVNGGIG